MFAVGQEVVIKGDFWVYSQSVGQLFLDKWTKVMTMKPVPCCIEAVGEDGWIIAVEKSRKIRYKVWPSALEQ